MFKTLFALIFTLCLVTVSLPAHAIVTLDQVSWETVGADVHFHLMFQNPDGEPSNTVTGELRSQMFGAFVGDHGLIGSFDVPSMPPGGSHEVVIMVALSQLPPSAMTILPGSKASGESGSAEGTVQLSCPPNTFWAGNVDVIWSGPGGTGQVLAHLGTVQICPGASSSYIHVVMNDCADPGGVSWSFSGVCADWTVDLVSSGPGGTPNGTAPNPIPPGPFDGWICISANATVVVGAQCCFDLNLTCGTQTATITVWADACEWEATPVVPDTWGSIKALYGKEEE